MLKRRVAEDQEDESARARLLAHYWRQDLYQERWPLIYWLIEHHP